MTFAKNGEFDKITRLQEIPTLRQVTIDLILKMPSNFEVKPSRILARSTLTKKFVG